MILKSTAPCPPCSTPIANAFFEGGSTSAWQSNVTFVIHRAVYDGCMTTNIDIQFRYAQHPTEDTMRAVAELYDVYGIRRVRLHQAERSVLVEYDATRLSSAVVFQLLRRAGLSVTEQISAFAPAPAAVAPDGNASPAA
jgi:hypothetical protein